MLNSELKVKAMAGAKKICGVSRCQAPYQCDHSNHKDCGLLKIGTESTCPLARYNIEPDPNPKPWWERKASEMRTSNEELFALCACCPNAEVTEEDGELVINRPRFFEACLDCPVKDMEDSISEVEAES